MKKIVAINASPRPEWNTGTLVREAARGAEAEGAEVTVIDLYKLEKFMGCMSCFACKMPATQGQCIYPDGLAPVLEQIRQADGLIMGTPNYLGNVSAGFRALYERLIFQLITYQKENYSYSTRKIPVLLIMTSNVAEAAYERTGYDEMLAGYEGTLNNHIGPTKVLISGDTLQVEDYSRFNWTIFDPEAKKARRAEVFPTEKEKAFGLGKDMAAGNWA